MVANPLEHLVVSGLEHAQEAFAEALEFPDSAVECGGNTPQNVRVIKGEVPPLPLGGAPVVVVGGVASTTRIPIPLVSRAVYTAFA